VTLCIAATAIPKIVSTMANIEMRAATHSAAGVLQQTRSLSIKSNTFYKVRYTNGTGGGIVYADLGNNHHPDSTDPQAQMGTTVLAYSAPSGIPALDSTNLGYDPTTTTAVGFSATGQPCTSKTNCAVGMVIYFTDTRSLGAPGWAAVSVSPAGRVNTWMWNGGAWAQ
jgi:Tfp pilus assembly protein FimT